MVKLGDYQPRGAGVVWRRKKDYPAFLAISEDRDMLSKHWEQFVKFAEEAGRKLKTDGHLVERAYVDPEIFPNWCREPHTRVNTEGRKCPLLLSRNKSTVAIKVDEPMTKNTHRYPNGYGANRHVDIRQGFSN